MKIGIDARALTKFKAGIGTYTYEIIKYLNKIDSKNEYYIFSNKEIVVDFKLNENFKIINFKSRIGTFRVILSIAKNVKRKKHRGILGNSALFT